MKQRVLESNLFLSDQLFSIARTIASGFYTTAKSLRHAEFIQESIDATFNILLQLGETLPRASGDEGLNGDIHAMNYTLQNIPDDSILGMQDTTNERIVILLKVYAHLANLLHHTKPSLVGAVSLRMVELTMKNGLASTSPISFAFYGEMLTSIGCVAEGCRLGNTMMSMRTGVTHFNPISNVSISCLQGG